MEMPGTVDENHQLQLDGVLPIAGPKRVRVLVLSPPEFPCIETVKFTAGDSAVIKQVTSSVICLWARPQRPFLKIFCLI